MSWRTPELTNTFRTPSTSEIDSRRSTCAVWSMGSMGQGLDPRHLLSSHLPLARFLAHSMPYMLAVGPPTSWMTPLNPGADAMRRASLIIDSLLLETTVVPWWAAMAQKEQSP